MIEEIETVRAKQKARRNAAWGIASFIGSVLASTIIHLGSMSRAEADKERITAQSVDEKVAIQNQLAAFRFEFTEKVNALDKRLDHIEWELSHQKDGKK